MALAPRRVPVRYFLLLRDALRGSGVDTTLLLQMAGIDSALFDNRESTLTVAEVDAFVQAASQLTGRSDLGFEMGRRIKMNSHDLLGYGLMSCPTSDEFIRMCTRHYHLMVETWSMSYRRMGSVGECVYTPLVAMPWKTMVFYLEALALAHQNQMQLVLGERVSPYDIYMSMSEPPHILRYQALFPVRFHFEAGAMPGVRVLMPAEMLDLPLALGDVEVMRQIDERCSALGTKPPRGEIGWTEYVMMILRETPGAHITLEDLAERVQVSARTIDRYLKKDGLGFRELSDKVRFERACALLSEPGATAASVAVQLGYSDAPNFARAFRRVMGETPGDFQRRSRV